MVVRCVGSEWVHELLGKRVFLEEAASDAVRSEKQPSGALCQSAYRGSLCAAVYSEGWLSGVLCQMYKCQLVRMRWFLWMKRSFFKRGSLCTAVNSEGWLCLVHCTRVELRGGICILCKCKFREYAPPVQLASPQPPPDHPGCLNHSLFLLPLLLTPSPQILVTVGVSEPSVVSLLQQLSSNEGAGTPGVRLFFESPPELQNASSLQGWTPWVSWGRHLAIKMSHFNCANNFLTVEASVTSGANIYIA
eukprot:scaffold117436_cov20-Tisochrysis_lutea.AAC.2